MMRLESDLVELCNAALDKTLDQCTAQWKPQNALGVVMAAGGYPMKYQKHKMIHGLPTAQDPHLKVFHAGTRFTPAGVETSGGRVLCVVGLGDTVTHAQKLAYASVAKIHWEDAYYRKDIGHRAIAREAQG